MENNMAQEVPRENGSPGDGRPGVGSTSQKTSDTTLAAMLPSVGDTYEKTKSCADMKGELFEVKMAAMLFLRLVNCETVSAFRLATNVEAAGALDDAVLTFTTTGDPTLKQSAFIQLKHKKKGVLWPQSFSGTNRDFALKKYLKSFLKIKKTMSKDERPVLLDGDFENCHFVIYTNAPPHKTLSEHFREEKKSDLINILKSDSKNGLIFQFSEESDVYSSLMEDEDTRVEAKQFLHALTVYSGQPDESQLDDIIKKELLRACPDETKTSVDLIYPYYEETFKHWWRDSNLILDQNSKILEEAIDKYRINTLSSLQEKEFCFNLKFQSSHTFTDLYDKYSMIHLVTSELYTKLSCTKLVQSLQNLTDNYIFLSLESLLRKTAAAMSSWRTKNKTWLVIVSKSSETHEDLINTLCQHSKTLKANNCIKKIILVSALDDMFTMNLKERLNETCHEISDSFHLMQLDSGCVEMVKKKKVLFQGATLTLDELFDNEVEFPPGIFNDDFAHKVLGTRPMSFGCQHNLDIPYYIPRTLEKRDILNKDIFKRKVSSDVFIVNNITEKELQELVPPGEIVGNVADYNRVSCRYLVAGSGTSEYVRKVFAKKENVHEIQICSDGNLRCISTNGSLDRINAFITQDKVTSYNPSTALDLEGRVVLITAEAGMGKSTLVSHLASETKKANPSLCVIRVELKDHFDLLETLYDDAARFLSAAIGTSQSTSENALLHLMLEKGKCVVMLDGFDEIAPEFTDKGLSLLTCMLKSNARKIYVTSRHALSTKLSTHLQTITYTLRKFDANDQITFFKTFWSKGKVTSIPDGQLENLILKLVDLIASSLNDQENAFMGTPLVTMMLAEIYEEFYEDQKSLDDLPKKLNVITMFEQIIDKKFKIYLNKKFGDLKNIGRAKKQLLKSVTENHVYASLCFLLSKEQLGALHDGKIIMQQNVDISDAFDESDHQAGIITKVENNKLIFLHRTFAEYFTALWFFHNYDTSQKFLRKHWFSGEFQFIQRLFVLMLARKSELLTAVVNGDRESVRTFLSSGVDVNVKDLGGRSALMLGVSGTTLYDDNVSMVGILLEHGADCLAVDKVLGWNVLEYAINTKAWYDLEQVLDNITMNIGEITGRHLAEETPSDFYKYHGFEFGFNTNEFRKILLHAVCQQGNADGVQSAIMRLKDCMRYIFQINTQVSIRLSSTSALQVCPEEGDRVKDAVAKYINAQDFMDMSSLHHASEHGNARVIELLISNGGDIWLRDESGRLPISYACWGNVNMVQDLCENKGISEIASFINPLVNIDLLPQIFDVHGKDSKVMQLVMNLGPNILRHIFESNTPQLVSCTSDADADADVDIVDALMSSDVDIVKALVAGLGEHDMARYINARDSVGKTAIHYACQRKTPKLLKLLISKGGDTRLLDNYGQSPLHSACTHLSSNVDLIAILIANQGEDSMVEYINAKDSEGNTALHSASIKVHPEAIDALISKGGDVWSLNKKGQTPLHVNCESTSCNHESAKVIIASLRQEDVAKYINTPDFSGRSALHYVFNRIFFPKVIDLLISKGGDIWAKDSNGQTILHSYCKSLYDDNIEVTTNLIARLGANDVAEYINVKDYAEMSALMYACNIRETQMIELLISKGGDVWATNSDGQTSLHLNCKSLLCNVKSVEAIIKNLEGNDVARYVSIKDSGGKCAVHYATGGGFTEVVELLTQSSKL